jgi:hypothetical protein
MVRNTSNAALRTSDFVFTEHALLAATGNIDLE